MASDDPGIREFKLNEEPLFRETLPETGTLEHRLEDGTIIRAEVVGSSISGYAAFDSEGNSIPVYRMRISEGSPPDATTKTRVNSCWYCICNPSCQCWPEPCPVA